MKGERAPLRVMLLCDDPGVQARCSTALGRRRETPGGVLVVTKAEDVDTLDARSFDVVVCQQRSARDTAAVLSLVDEGRGPALVIVRQQTDEAGDLALLLAGAQDVVAAARIEEELARSVRFAAARQHVRGALREANRCLADLAARDTLTGLSNRRGLRERLRVALDAAARETSLVAALIIDLDHFKTINDTRGHATGDEVLVRVADVLRSMARSTDLVGRIGGDEFVVLLPNIDLVAARAVGQRLCVELRDTVIETRTGPVSVTCSVGAITVPGTTATLTDLLGHARAALARSKREGRNRVSMSLPAGALDPAGERRVTTAAVDAVKSVEQAGHVDVDLEP